MIVILGLAALIREHAPDLDLAPQMLIIEAAILDRVHDWCSHVSVETWSIFAHLVPEIACIFVDGCRWPCFISMTGGQNNATLALRGSFRDTHSVHIFSIDQLLCIVLWRHSW